MLEDPGSAYIPLLSHSRGDSGSKGKFPDSAQVENLGLVLSGTH
jgi:hypothetical protein